MTELTPQIIAAVEAHQKVEREKNAKKIESEREQKLLKSIDKIKADFEALKGKTIVDVEVFLHKSYAYATVTEWEIKLDDDTSIRYSYDQYDNETSVTVGNHYMP